MDANTPKSRLSEISHLFLSDIRDRQTEGLPRPQRKAPGASTGAFNSDVSVDLTPEEFAQAFGDAGHDAAHSLSDDQSPAVAFKPVRAVIAHHLGEHMADRVRDLAGHLAGRVGRTGVIYAAAGDVRVGWVENNAAEHAEEDPAVEPMDAARLRETLVELNHDVDQWLLVLPDPRETSARELLKTINHWTLLTGHEHDAVVNTYRTLKGVCDVAKPTLSVAIFNAEDEDELQKTFRKLASVCQQFLQVEIALLGAVPAAESAAEHVALHASDTGPTSGTQWHVLGGLIAHAAPVTATRAATTSMKLSTNAIASTAPPHNSTKPARAGVTPPALKIAAETAAPMTTAAPVVKEIPAMSHAFTPAPAMQIASQTQDADTAADVIDLPDADASPEAILAAVIRGGGTLVQTPVAAPQLPGAAVAVSRDRKLVLVAAARPGLLELRAVAAAYHWMNENKALIAMALPQFAIDTAAPAGLHLLIDHADLGNGTLKLIGQTVLSGGEVTVTAYRKLRWAGRTGLLLEAA